MKYKINCLRSELKKYLNKFKIGTKTMFKEFFNKKTNKKQRANMWTFTRLITPAVSISLSTIALIFNVAPLFVLAGSVTLLGSFTDFFDGRSARKYNSTSEYGKQLDQIADKVFATAIGINLAIINPIYLTVILGEAIIGTINIFYKINYDGLKHKSTMVGRIKEWPLFATLAIGYFTPVSSTCMSIVNTLLPVTLLMQLSTAASYIVQNNNEINDIKKKVTNTEKKVNFDNAEKINYEKNKQNTNNKKLEQYINLKNLLQKIIEEEKNKDLTIEQKNIQKTKR